MPCGHPCRCLGPETFPLRVRKKDRRVWQFPDVHFSVIRDFSFIFGFGLDDSLLFGFPLS